MSGEVVRVARSGAGAAAPAAADVGARHQVFFAQR